MKLTNEAAIKALEKVRVLELEEMISGYPEQEVDGRSDWDMIANEAGWLLDSYNSDDTVRNEDLPEARGILASTRYGKIIPVNARTLKPIYSPVDIQIAKDTVNEYNRLTRFVKKLKSMGLYCPYC